ncbi:FadR family transcriptional regulator [Aureimonas flava]|uniref:FadR family transcriptional regulator n=1 Tax=Aureimonas flava TaxID=2320271 RepID=A0A3A1WN19_9HYPH|nr:FadR/GntR family transcriptional regulator [Aureimonas flava]RIY03298.1 FadR family transcriptional regulator [Aureimonas flava]
MPLEAIEPRRLYRQVADQLRLLIESGEYGVGDRLPTERDLAERLAISRPTVREALIALEVEGRIRIRVGSGIYVTAPPAETPVPGEIEGPFELLHARELIESSLAREAARKATPEDVAALDTVLARMDAGRHPSPETIALDREFHVSVARILGNAVVTRFVGELFDQRMTPYFARLSQYFENGQTWRVAHAEHRTVRDAIAAGDPEAAEAAMRRHLQQSQIRFQHSFGEDAGIGRVGGRTPAKSAARRAAKTGARSNGRNDA